MASDTRYFSRTIRSVRKLAPLMLAACVVICAWTKASAAELAPAVKETVFVMSADQDEKTFAGKWVWLIYTEAFKRLGMKFQLLANPMTRQSLLADDGLVDGEVARIHAYGDKHPNLVRVEEPVLDLVFSLYTANPALRASSIDDLKNSAWHAEYRRGVGICQTVLTPLFGADKLSNVTTSEQAANKLLAGRTDIYCDNEVSMLRVLHSSDIKHVGRIRKVLPIGDAIPTYPYLHKKHAALAPRLATVLKKMKEEGLMESYRAQAERDMGWLK